jgi:hypothetical protein
MPYELVHCAAYIMRPVAEAEHVIGASCCCCSKVHVIEQQHIRGDGEGDRLVGWWRTDHCRLNIPWLCMCPDLLCIDLLFVVVVVVVVHCCWLLLLLLWLLLLFLFLLLLLLLLFAKQLACHLGADGRTGIVRLTSVHSFRHALHSVIGINIIFRYESQSLRTSQPGGNIGPLRTDRYQTSPQANCCTQIVGPSKC